MRRAVLGVFFAGALLGGPIVLLGVARAPIAAEELFGMGELISPDGDLRTLPCHLAEQGGMDGFYAARLKKTLPSP